MKLEGLKEQVKFGPSGPNVVLRSQTPRWLNFPKPQTPKLWNFLRFHNFIEFVLWFWRKWGPVCEIRRLKGASEIWPKWPQTPRSLNLSKPQSPKLWNFLRFYVIEFILWFWRKWGRLWKLEPRFLTYVLIQLLGPNCSKPVFRSKNPNVTHNSWRMYSSHVYIFIL